MPDPTPLTRGDRRRMRTRAALLDAGRRLFAERDAASVTIQEITEAADVAKGSFYNHFESREELQRRAAEEALEELGASLDREVAEREADPARVIAQSLLATMRACIANPSLGAFVLRNTDILDLGEAILSRGRRDLLHGRRSGRFEIDDVDVLLAALAGASQQILRGRLAGRLRASAETRFVALVLRLLGVESAEARKIATETANRTRRNRST